MNGLKNPGFSQSQLKYEQTLSKVITTIVKYVICYIISAIYSGGLDARRESSENWNNLLFLGSRKQDRFLARLVFLPDIKMINQIALCSEHALAQFFSFVFFQTLNFTFFGRLYYLQAKYSSQSVSFTFFPLTFFIFYFINVMILSKYLYYKKCYQWLK